jgi:hypothetical protein
MAFSQGVKAPKIRRVPDETIAFSDAKLEVFRNGVHDIGLS